jgi:hypothetical protein
MDAMQEPAGQTPALLLRTYMITVTAGLVARLPPRHLRRLLLLRRRGRREPGVEAAFRVQAAVDHVQTSGWPLVRKGCLSRGLTLFWLLRRSGVDDLSLAFGVGPADRAPTAHCWLVRNKLPYFETTDPTEMFTEIWRIDSDDIGHGRRL